MGMDPILREGFYAIILLSWVIFVSIPLTRWLYSLMRGRGLSHGVAIYFNRKVIHILAGGLIALLVPRLFSTPLMPLSMSLILAALLYIPHRTGRLLTWFQTPENLFEVHFCIAWGLAITLGWLLTEGDFRLGVIPVLYMSFGDAVTGVVRNLIFRRRTKSWWGNLAMAAVCLPIGCTVGLWGVVSAIVAAFIEHFEFGPIDDNLTIPSTSFLILYLTYPRWS